jgi:diguanylate cyclase (GGDEF)-like protein
MKSDVAALSAAFPALLPDPFARVARLASVPRELRSLLSALGPFFVEAWLPESPAMLTHSQRQLFKLCSAAGPLRLTRTRASADGNDPAFVFERSGRSVHFAKTDLERDLGDIVRHAMAELCSPLELAGQAEAYALELARHETVRKLTSRMLEAGDLDHALTIMLLGITSGYGASFHRAALFTFDAAADTFFGKIAVGPSSEEEAHRIWEAIELEEKTLEQAIDDYPAGIDTLFQAFVRTCELSAGRHENDEIAAAVASHGPLLYPSSPPTNAGLARLLAPATQFVIAAIRPRDETLGLIVADNAYGDRPITREQTSLFSGFVDPLSLVWQTRSLLRKVDALARNDALTGVFNRRELESRFGEEQSRCVRSGRPISVAVLDLDHFKTVNDTRGHEAGDAVLRTIGALLQRTLRPHDLVCRYGGDEFVLMLAECTKAELLSAVTRIGRLAKDEGISLSIGGATWPDDCAEPTRLIAVADANLYEAKAAGRGCAVAKGTPPVSF